MRLHKWLPGPRLLGLLLFVVVPWPAVAQESENSKAENVGLRRHALDQLESVSSLSQFQESSLATRNIRDWALTNTILLSTVDGDLVALDRGSGETQWTIKGSKNAISVSDSHTLNSNNAWFVEPIGDGTLFYFDTQKGLERIPLGIKALVSSSPFVIPGDSKVFVGRRDTSMLSVDVSTGAVLKEIGTNKFALGNDQCYDLGVDGGRCEPHEGPHFERINIGKTDYTVAIVDGNVGVWNTTFTEWTPNVADRDLQQQYIENPHPNYLASLHDGRVVYYDYNTGAASWFRFVSGPVLQTFDIFEMKIDADRAQNPKLVLSQPERPSFRSIHDDEEEEEEDGTSSTFINVTSSGSWYALSEDRFPLVKEAPVARWYNMPSEIRQMGLSPWHDELIGRHNVQSEPGYINPPLIEGVQYVEPAPKEKEASIWHTYAFSLLILIGVFFFGRFFNSSNIKFFIQNSKRQGLTSSVTSAISALSQGEDDSSSTSSGNKSESAGSLHPETSQDKKITDASPGLAENLTNPASTAIEDDLRASSSESHKEDEVLEVQPRKRRGARGKKHRKGKAIANDGEAPAKVAHDMVSDETNDDDGNIWINNLLITNQVLGTGSNGTFVYKGEWEGRDIAVKRMLRECFEVAAHEVKLLQQSDEHPNIVRYYCTQNTPRFIYMALELCLCSIHEWVEKPMADIRRTDTLDSRAALEQIASGVKYIHSLKLVHRDIKPGNILVARPKPKIAENRGSTLSIRISDLGLSKKLEMNQMSFGATTAHAAGTSGWRAPELLSEDPRDDPQQGGSGLDQQSGTSNKSDQPFPNRRATQAIDIFAMGCVFYYILSNGDHPYGSQYLREGNILKDEKDLSALDGMGEEGALAEHLISEMLSKDAAMRPTATLVLSHPFFWSSAKKLAFLMDISDRFEVEQRDPPSPLLCMLEEEAPAVIGNDYQKRLDKGVLENLGKYRKYNGKKLLDLLRAMRNKRHHYQDLPAHTQAVLGTIPNGFSDYFTSRFPLLVLKTWMLVRRTICSEDQFADYFPRQQ